MISNTYAQPPLNLTQKLGSVIMQIQSYSAIIKSVVDKSIVKFVQVSSFVVPQQWLNRDTIYE